MLLDMTQILSGAVDRLEFSYTLSADCIPYEGAPETEDETDAVQTAKVGEDEGIYPIVFDDVVVLRVKRGEEFAPIKNAQGVDSPETARKLYKAFMEV